MQVSRFGLQPFKLNDLSVLLSETFFLKPLDNCAFPVPA